MNSRSRSSSTILSRAVATLGGIVATSMVLAWGATTWAADGSDDEAVSLGVGSVFAPDGASATLPRGVRLVVGAGATWEAKFTSRLPVGPRGAKVLVQTVQVDGGRVDALLSEDEAIPRGVLLQAPDKILGISTGGHMAVSVTEDAIFVAALEGDVLVGQASRFKPLASGNVRRFSRVGGATEDFELPKAPELATSAGLTVAWAGPAKLPVVVKGGGRNVLALVDGKGRRVGDIVESREQTPVDLVVPRAGIFSVVAKTIGEGGFGGQSSDPLTLRVLGLAPGEPGPTDGVFLLDRGERLELAGVEGLEMRYGQSSTYVPASNSVGLPQGRAATVEFRDPSDPTDTLSVRLAPLIEKSVIQLSPAGAVWPGKPIKIRVGLWDGAGRLLPLGGDVKAEVTVNSAPVGVEWQRTKAGFVAHLGQQGGEGPWVVRVSATDRRGHTIARDFLEVAGR